MKQRNLSIDLVKVFASISVVFIHTRLYGIGYEGVGTEFFQFFGRFAVPFFILCGGYYYKGKNLNTFNDILKKMVLFYILYYIINTIVYPLFGLEAKAYIKWYFYSYATLLLLAKKQNFRWLVILFIISFTWILAVGDVIDQFDPLKDMDYYEEFIVRGNSAIVYLYLFITGIWLRKVTINPNKLLGSILLAIAVIMIGLSATKFHYNQYEIYNSIVALLLLLATIQLPIYTTKNLKDYYFDIFMYHCLVLPFSYLIVKPATLFAYLSFSMLTIIFALALAKIIKYFDKKCLDGILYTT